MPYDSELDKEIASKEVTVGETTFEVSLRSYNGGEGKVSITAKGARFPVKRLTVAQFLAIAEIVRSFEQAE